GAWRRDHDWDRAVSPLETRSGPATMPADSTGRSPPPRSTPAQPRSRFSRAPYYSDGGGCCERAGDEGAGGPVCWNCVVGPADGCVAAPPRWRPFMCSSKAPGSTALGVSLVPLVSSLLIS